MNTKNPVSNILKRRAVFFDRDGTLMEEVHFCNNPAHVRTFPGMKDALAQLREAGWLIFVITNQSGMTRGIVSQPQYEAVHKELLRQLDHQIDATYFCPELSESPRRKPNIGMVLEAASDFPVNLSQSYFIGDKASDIECGKRAGMRTILVSTGYGVQNQNCGADYLFSDALAAANFILKMSS